MSRVSTEKCIQGGCRFRQGSWCRTCGFQVEEAERRKKIPLTQGKDGLLRKYLGLVKSEGTQDG